jgi:hypothetical protein
MSENSIIPIERIAERIYLIRGEKVMLDYDLAELYGIPTKALNQAVTRNLNRFPQDFMFKLSSEETEACNRSQIVTGSQKHRDPRYPPRVFTQEGVAMLSSVLRSERAVQINIAIMRTFVRLREMLATHKDLARKVEEHDRQIANLYAHVERLLKLPEGKSKPIGYIWPKDNGDKD